LRFSKSLLPENTPPADERCRCRRRMMPRATRPEPSSANEVGSGVDVVVVSVTATSSKDQKVVSFWKENEIESLAIDAPVVKTKEYVSNDPAEDGLSRLTRVEPSNIALKDCVYTEVSGLAASSSNAKLMLYRVFMASDRV